MSVPVVDQVTAGHDSIVRAAVPRCTRHGSGDRLRGSGSLAGVGNINRSGLHLGVELYGHHCITDFVEDLN